MSTAQVVLISALTVVALRLATWLGWVFLASVHQQLHAEAEANEPPTEAPPAVGFHMETVPLDEQDDSPEELP